MIVDSQVHIWGVDRAVIVPPSWEGDRNDLALEAARLHPSRFGVMGRFDPEAPQAGGTIATWLRQPGMLGMRFAFHLPWLAARDKEWIMGRALCEWLRWPDRGSLPAPG